MREFSDKNGGKWAIDLTVGGVMRVHTASDKAFDLFDPAKDDLGKRLSDSLPTFWEVLWLIVEPQARERKVSAEQFGELMAADSLIAAQRLFFEEWRDFFRSLQQPHKEKIVELLAEAQTKALELVRAKMTNPAMANLGSRIEIKMSEKLETSFGSLLESLDSILGPSP